jgi:predicted enzyme related to lactoylglutathione lyase
MDLHIEALAVDTPDPDRLARFYEQLLGWQRTYDDDGEVQIEDPDGAAVPLLFLEVGDEKVTKNRLHLDLRPDDQAAAVQRALDLGAAHVDIGQHDDPDVTWVVLADPDGNELCILRDRDDPIA